MVDRRARRGGADRVPPRAVLPHREPDRLHGLGLGLFTPLALAGTVFYLIHHIVVKTNLFLVGGIVRRLGGTLTLWRASGASTARRPGLALLFLVPAFSLAGIPPLSGFWGKLVLVKAGLDAGGTTR